MEKINKKGIKCDECGSTNTVKYNSIANISAAILILGIMGTSICVVLPFFWIAIPVMVIFTVIGLIGSVLSLFIKNYRLTCNDCKTKYKLSKEEYKSCK